MSAYQSFKKTGFKTKIKIVAKHGIFIESRQAFGCTIRLFAIQDFYIEIWSCWLLPWRNIINVHTFKKSSHLTPYLNRIDIKALLSRGSLHS
ncbi:hypothetical protein WJR50_07130 [Catalinimonas sp. 4WD22]|uniref:hypothetical protein n=1 Tax=Catalinimonas locisalis TaxID=3133978 RepID=UPI003100DAE1